MADPAPIEGRVKRWDAGDRVGAVELNSGEVVRFGGTACKGLTPAVGMTVYVNGLQPHPLGGRSAQVVRTEALTETEAARREAARVEAENAKRLRPLVDAERRLPRVQLAEDFTPSIDKIISWLDPRTASLLRALKDESDLVVGGIEVSMDGTELPWPFYDPSLWSFGIDGGGNVFALHCYPPALEKQARLPVVFWDHEFRQHYFQAASLDEFLGQYLQLYADADPSEKRRCKQLAKHLDVRLAPPGPDRLREDPDDGLDWPLPTSRDLAPVPLSEVHRKERDLVRKLIDASRERSLEGVIEPLAALDALYQELGWTHHLDVLRHQRVEWFNQQERILLKR